MSEFTLDLLAGDEKAGIPAIALQSFNPFRPTRDDLSGTYSIIATVRVLDYRHYPLLTVRFTAHLPYYGPIGGVGGIGKAAFDTMGESPDDGYDGQSANVFDGRADAIASVIAERLSLGQATAYPVLESTGGYRCHSEYGIDDIHLAVQTTVIGITE